MDDDQAQNGSGLKEKKRDNGSEGDKRCKGLILWLEVFQEKLFVIDLLEYLALFARVHIFILWNMFIWIKFKLLCLSNWDHKNCILIILFNLSGFIIKLSKLLSMA